jgi:hypothetical protein
MLQLGKLGRFLTVSASTVTSAVDTSMSNWGIHSMASWRSRLVAAALVGLLFGAGAFWLATAGMRALNASEAVTDSTEGASVPAFVYAPPETVPTTEEYGPVGPVSVVFAVPHVQTGLTGELKNPWVAVSSVTGEYRALIAPHRPAPRKDAVSVAPDGLLLAWGYQRGVVFYDPVRDTVGEARGIGEDPEVGPFSPDSRYLLLRNGTPRVLDVESGEIVATLDGLDDAAAHQAVWTPDSTALTYVQDGRLVTLAWDSGRESAVPTSIPPDATLAWKSNGEQLAAMTEARGVRSVDVYDVTNGGRRLHHAWLVSPDGYAQERLLGFTGENRVTVTALSMQTGPLPLVFAMSTVDTTQPAQVMQLNGGGIDWSTLEVASEPLAAGSTSFDEPNWPVSDLAKLVGSGVVTLFVVGLYLTRPARRHGRR